MLSERFVVGLSAKHAEVILFTSFTVNLCMFSHVFGPWVCSVITRRVLGRRKEIFTKLEDEIPGFFGRLATSLPFFVGLPVCGLVLLVTSNVTHTPFFAFNQTMRITFSISLGHYIYKTAELIYWRREAHYKPLLVHHTVAIATYTVILCFEQNAILGVIGMFLKGHVVFAEFDNDKISVVTDGRTVSKVLKITAVIAFVGAVILNGLVPGLLVLYSVVTSSHELLKMDYVPLAFFFLSIVFFSAVAGWFFKDALHGLKKILTWPKKLTSVLRDFNAQPLNTVVNHQGLGKLYEYAKGSAVVHIKCNDLWDRDLSQLCSGLPLDEKVRTTDMVEINFESPIVLKNTNLM